MKVVELNIYGFKIHVRSTHERLINLISRDFEYFLSENQDCDLELEVILTKKLPKIPPLPAKKQSLNSITYQKDPIRYNDYYGEALSVFDYQNEKAKLFSKELNLAHELTFLLIQSRAGKWLDSQGLHRVHACGLSTEKGNFIIMLPMKGGKSTLFFSLLRDKRIKIISDDSPILSSKGEVLPFPLRAGTLDPEKWDYLDSKLSYQISRKQYGLKTLFPISAFPNSITTTQNKPLYLIDGIRRSDLEFRFSPIGRLALLKSLLQHYIVGLGLPVIIEYFIEGTPKDWFRNLVNLFSRIKGSLILITKAKGYRVELGGDIQKNINQLRDFMGLDSE